MPFVVCPHCGKTCSSRLNTCPKCQTLLPAATPSAKAPATGARVHVSSAFDPVPAPSDISVTVSPAAPAAPSVPAAPVTPAAAPVASSANPAPAANPVVAAPPVQANPYAPQGVGHTHGPVPQPPVPGATPKFCPNCGKGLPSGAQFCGNCGHRVAVGGASPAVPPPPPAAGYNPYR